MNMRPKKGWLYGRATVTDPTTKKRRQIEFALSAKAGQERKAIINYGKILEGIERGELPNTKNEKFESRAEKWKLYPVSLKGRKGRRHDSKDNLEILDETLIPYFGKMQIKDISEDIVKRFLAVMETDERPQTAKKKKTKQVPKGLKQSTLDKYLKVLRWVMQSAIPTWEPPYWEFKNKEKPKLDYPKFEEISAMIDKLPSCSKEFGEVYQDIAWFIALTGLDISDVLRLTLGSFEGVLVSGNRGKTGKYFKLAIPEKLRAILKKKPQKIVDITKSIPIFDVPSADAVATAIIRAFGKVGLPQYHSKSMRDFQASTLFNAGFSENYIQVVLGHSLGSKETRKYTLASAEKLEEASCIFDQLQEDKRKVINDA